MGRTAACAGVLAEPLVTALAGPARGETVVGEDRVDPAAKVDDVAARGFAAPSLGRGSAVSVSVSGDVRGGSSPRLGARGTASCAFSYEASRSRHGSGT